MRTPLRIEIQRTTVRSESPRMGGTRRRTALEARSLEQMSRPRFGADAFRGIRRKAIDLSRTSIVQAEELAPGRKLPLLITPAMPDVNLAEWARENQQFIETKIHEHGGILFRDF